MNSISPKISQGQKGTISYNEKDLAVVVLKVIPEVKEGRFQVELNFENQNVLNLRQGTSLSVRLNLSEETQSLVVPKGSFYTDTNGEWIFVVKGNSAERRNIKLGRENPVYYEVLEGLQPNERVITSTYADYQNIQKINITD